MVAFIPRQHRDRSRPARMRHFPSAELWKTQGGRAPPAGAGVYEVQLIEANLKHVWRARLALTHVPVSAVLRSAESGA